MTTAQLLAAFLLLAHHGLLRQAVEAAVKPLACEASRMCSLDAVKPYFGDITPSECVWCDGMQSGPLSCL